MSYIYVTLNKLSWPFQQATRTYKTQPVSSCRGFLARKFPRLSAVMTPEEVERFRRWASGVEGWGEGDRCPVDFTPLQWFVDEVDGAVWYFAKEFSAGAMRTVDGLYRLDHSPYGLARKVRLGLPVESFTDIVPDDTVFVHESLESAKRELVRLFNVPANAKNTSVVLVRPRT